MDLFQQNKQQLLASQGHLAPVFKSLDKISLDDLTLLPLRRKPGFSLQIRKKTEDQEILLHSLYDPHKEAQKMVDDYHLESSAVTVILGLGLGYHVYEALSRLDAGDVLCVIEPRLDVFKQFLQTVDMGQWPNLDKLLLSVGEDLVPLFRVLRGRAIEIRANSIRIIRHPPSVKANPGFFAKVIDMLDETERWAVVNVQALINKAEAYSSNVFANAHHWLQWPGIDDLVKEFEGVPAIVISAGPSLNKNLHLLRRAQNRALLICVDTALQLVLKEGITPHFVCSIDYTDHNLRYFKNIPQDQLQNICLFADPEVHPAVIDSYPGPVFMSNLPGKSLCDCFNQILGPIAGLDKGLSVAHTAFELAWAMGAKVIALVGQDLAFSDDLSHAQGTAMSRIEKESMGDSKPVEVLDIFGKTIKTSLPMSVFIKHFEELIYSYPGRCIDATEGGAAIPGSEVRSLKDFLHSYARQEIDLQGRLFAMQTKKRKDVQAIMHSLEQIEARLNNYLQVAKNCQKWAKAAKHTLPDLQKRAPARFAQAYKTWSKHLTELSQYSDFMELIKENIMEALVLKSTKKARPTVNDLLDQQDIPAVSQVIDENVLFVDIVHKALRHYVQGFRTVRQKLQELCAVDESQTHSVSH